MQKELQITAWKVSVFGVFLVRIFPHSDWIRRDVSLLIYFECRKIRTRKTPNADTFHAVDVIDHSHLEEFHEILREYTDIPPKIVLKTKIFTYHNLKGITNYKNLVVLKEDKDSSLVLIDKLNYVSKLQRLIEEGINNGVYALRSNIAPKSKIVPKLSL